MSLIEPHPGEFDWFGPSRITSRAIGTACEIELPGDLRAARQMVRSQIPATPGVYGWLNADRQLIYVGKSKALRQRLASYFAEQTSDPKMGRIRRHSQRLIWEPVAHELLALLREQELIYRWRPDFNSQGQPTRRQPAFVCLSDTAAPHAYVAKRLTTKSGQVFGPILGTKRLQESVDAINHVFRLRDCSDKTKFEFGAQLTLFAEPPRAQCIRYELGSCPGPCAHVCSVETYRAHVAAAEAFLAGRDRETLPRLEQEMQSAASRWHFERAGILKHQWQALSRLDRQLQRLRHSETKIEGVLSCPVARGRQLWMVLRKGRLVSTVVEPRSERQAAETRELLLSTRGAAPEPTGHLLEIFFQIIIASWFKRNPQNLAFLRPLSEMIVECEKREVSYSKAS